MELSKFFNYVKASDKIYAIFNSLLMDVYYVNTDEFNEIIKIKPELYPELSGSGIYVRDSSIDDEVFELVTHKYLAATKDIEILYLIVTDNCNLRCKYCYLENVSDEIKVSNMSIDTALNALRKFGEYRSSEENDSFVILYGGEPLINFNLIKEIVLTAKNEYPNLHISIITNGTLINSEVADFFAANNMEIGLSIDGPKVLNDSNRVFEDLSKSVYDLVDKSLQILSERNCDFGLSITLSPTALRYKDELLRWIIEKQTKKISFNLMQFGSPEDNWESYIKEANEFLHEAYDALYLNGIYESTIFRKINSFTNNAFKYANCAAIGANQIVIKPNGDLTICQGYTKSQENKLGNIVDYESFSDILVNRELDVWVNMATIYKEECLKCEAISIYGGGCVLESESLFGSKSDINKAFCYHSKEMFTWMIRRTFQKSDPV